MSKFKMWDCRVPSCGHRIALVFVLVGHLCPVISVSLSHMAIMSRILTIHKEDSSALASKLALSPSNVVQSVYKQQLGGTDSRSLISTTRWPGLSSGSGLQPQTTTPWPRSTPGSDGVNVCGRNIPIHTARLCPSHINFANCYVAEYGALCKGDGKCGTSSNLQNCHSLGSFVVYRKHPFNKFGSGSGISTSPWPRTSSGSGFRTSSAGGSFTSNHVTMAPSIISSTILSTTSLTSVLPSSTPTMSPTSMPSMTPTTFPSMNPDEGDSANISDDVIYSAGAAGGVVVLIFIVGLWKRRAIIDWIGRIKRPEYVQMTDSGVFEFPERDIEDSFKDTSSDEFFSDIDLSPGLLKFGGDGFTD